MKTESKTESLLDRTRRLLDATNLTYRQIADGCGVDANWLMKFKQGRIEEPGVIKIQKLHDFLIAYNAILVSPSAA